MKEKTNLEVLGLVSKLMLEYDNLSTAPTKHVCFITATWNVQNDARSLIGYIRFGVFTKCDWTNPQLIIPHTMNLSEFPEDPIVGLIILYIRPYIHVVKEPKRLEMKETPLDKLVKGKSKVARVFASIGEGIMELGQKIMDAFTER